MKLSLVAVVLALAARSEACDFCMGGGKEFRSLQAEMEGNKTVALARLAGRGADGRARFNIEKVLKGGTGLAAGSQVFLDASFYTVPRATYLLLGKSDGAVQDVVVLNPRSVAFVEKLSNLPEKQSERLLFFAPYLRDPDSLIAASAREEFAKTPYATVKSLRPHLKPDEIVKEFEEGKVPRSSRGIVLLMIGISGSKKHLPKLEAWVADAKWQQKPGYDALLASYLLLRGPDGRATIQKVLAGINADARSRPGVYFMRALRFHERDEKVLSREQILESIRHLLRYPSFADATLFELKRLEDWESLPLVLEMNRLHRKEFPWIERQVKEYLKVCPKPEAKAALEKMEGPR
jgi:hypothetical protein